MLSVFLNVLGKEVFVLKIVTTQVLQNAIQALVLSVSYNCN